MLSLSILTVVGLCLLKLSLNILAPRQWVLQQVVSDAYMTYERAYAERIPFENLLASDSPWPDIASASRTSSTEVEIGRLPGNSVITGTITRTRTIDQNYPVYSGNDPNEAAKAKEINPSAMKIWKVQSILTFHVGSRTYTKSRTVLRSQ